MLSGVGRGNDGRGTRSLGSDRIDWLEAMPGRFVVCDPSGVIVHVTKDALRLFGRPLEELVGQSFASSIELERPTSPLLPGLAEPGSERPCPAVVIHEGGVKLHTRLSARRSVIDGMELYVVALETPPEEAIEAPGSAEKAGQLYRSLFEQAPIGIFHFDRKATLTACNQAFAEIIGSPVRVLVGLEMASLPDQRMYAAAQRALEGEVVRMETTYHSATGGQSRDVRTVFAPVHEAATITSGIGIVLDVTAQKDAERALRQSNEALQAIFRRAPDGIAIVVEGRFVQVNPQIVSMLGFESADQLVGRPASELTHAMHRDAQADRLERTARGEHLPPVEYRAIRADGAERFFEVSSAPFEHEGNPAIVAFARDVTERRALEAHLVRTDRLASVGTLAAGVGHELNNPLGYVMLSLELMDRRLAAVEPSLRDELGELVERAREGCERIRTIVKDLAAFSRRTEGVAERVEVRRLVENAVRLVLHTVRHKATLTVDVNDVPAVAGNEAKLEQVVVNLLVNAAQAMPEGEADVRHVRVRTESDDRTVRIQVIDDGPGIPAEVIDRVFEPFFTTKPVGEGTGLGLAICHAIVQEHGGTITIDSRMGEGTTVTVSLPALAESESQADSKSEDVAIRAPRSRILVIDDERAFADSLREVLAVHHDVTVAYDGASALAELRRKAAYDLILCDVMMATRDGPNVYADIVREFPSLERRVVFMSGGAVTAGVRERLASLDVARLDKPFEAKDVERLLLEFARRR